MRPTVGEGLITIRKSLVQEILPEIPAQHAQRLCKKLASDLAQLERRWENVVPSLMEENDDLRAIFQAALSSLQEALAMADSVALRELQQQVRRVFEAGLGAEVKYPSYQLLEDRNRRYQELLVQAITALEETKDTHVGDAGLRMLHGDIRAHLRKYLDREAALRGIDPNAPWRD